jgi:hypothetical protein
VAAALVVVAVVAALLIAAGATLRVQERCVTTDDPFNSPTKTCTWKVAWRY